ncbi:MAG: TadE/TadG family type IV pilus assembly protein [Acidobacteriota bacterium]
MSPIRFARDEDGSMLVEAALSCTIVLALLLGICQMSLAMYIYHFTSEAAREATRYAIVRGSTSCTNTPNLTNCNATPDEIQTWVRSMGYPGITSSNVSVSTSWYSASGSMPTTWSACTTGTCNAPGNMVAITVTYPLTFQIPFSSGFALNLSNSSQMVISQ